MKGPSRTNPVSGFSYRVVAGDSFRDIEKEELLNTAYNDNTTPTVRPITKGDRSKVKALLDEVTDLNQVTLSKVLRNHLTTVYQKVLVNAQGDLSNSEKSNQKDIALPRFPSTGNTYHLMAVGHNGSFIPLGKKSKGFNNVTIPEGATLNHSTNLDRDSRVALAHQIKSNETIQHHLSNVFAEEPKAILDNVEALKKLQHNLLNNLGLQMVVHIPLVLMMNYVKRLLSLIIKTIIKKISLNPLLRLTMIY